MALFTVEVRGRPVLVFSSRDREAVGEALAAAISGDWALFGQDGRPIWDGESQLLLRQARPEEAARWQQGFARARNGIERSPDGTPVVGGQTRAAQ